MPSISKILEKVVYKRTYNYLTHNNILSNSQYGFRENHSTINAASELVFDTIHSLENKDSTLSVFLDLSKAFDTIDHQILLNKLEFYGIRGIPLTWFRSYLTGRKQFVKYQNCSSLHQDIICGVPQGSVLGPLLFLIYVNDLPHCMPSSKAIQFADDTTVYVSGRNIPELYKTMNTDLTILTDWFYANKLSLNVSKSNYILFTKHRNDSIVDKLSLKISGDTILRTNCFKFLGIYIDQNLSWNEHITVCQTRLTSALYAINKVKMLVPLSSLMNIYYTLLCIRI